MGKKGKKVCVGRAGGKNPKNIPLAKKFHKFQRLVRPKLLEMEGWTDSSDHAGRNMGSEKFKQGVLFPWQPSPPFCRG
ncbi:hypothetical protein TNCT_11421 [Trichonephila clavata]|uniref:Uncharacterized protein n=1 Tax=Trichonephila clavata TaxID=2740835 RepID=A0A8X6FPD2_TRICU|nr:hypothetical protein TNCT_11421 [Trichonephila clavata]